MHPRSKNKSKKLLKFDLISKWFLNDSSEAVRIISLSIPLLSLLWLVRWRSPLWLVYRIQREWQPWMDIMQMCYFVTYSRNRIRFKFLTTRSGDLVPTLFFLIDNIFICRALSASQLGWTFCVHILLHYTAWKVIH